MKRKLGFLVLCLCTIFLFILIITERRKIDLGITEDHRNIDYSVLLNLKYRHEPKCQGSNLLVLLVSSSARNFEAREYLRRSYSKEELNSLGVQRIFLLGEPAEGSTQKLINEENTKHEDLLQGSFQDTYQNLTVKHSMGLRWASSSCFAEFLGKMDDDIVLDLYEILVLLRNGTVEPDSLSGYVLTGMRVIREPSNKWYVSPGEFSPEFYPDFLSGWFYLTTLPSAKRLSQQLTRRSLFWIDDVFVTGIVRKESDLGLRALNRFYATDYRFLECCVKNRRRRLGCDFFAGPDGGRRELQLEFKDFAEFCASNCTPRVKGLRVARTCVAAYGVPRNPGNGTAKIRALGRV